MTPEHPITPPEDVIEALRSQAPQCDVDAGVNKERETQLGIAAYRAGADAELWACCELLDINGCPSKWIDMLRDVRRPKPPSLQEQALTQLDSLHADLRPHGIVPNTDTIRRALERLQQLEQENND